MNYKEVVIQPVAKQKFFNLQELKEYRDLLKFLVIRGIKAKYAQSVLGVAWAIIQPLFGAGIFTVVFGNFAEIGSDGVPYAIFSFTTMVFWTYFSNAMTESTSSLVANQNMVTKVYFPRIVLPLSSIIAKLLDLFIGILLLAIFLIVFNVKVTASILWVPVIFLILFFLILGLGLLLSALAVNYRDVKHAMTFFLQILMYLSPVVYPLSTVPEKYRLVYSLNPLVGIFESLRAVILHTSPLSYRNLAFSAVISLIIYILGQRYFNKTQHVFADVA